MMHRSRRSRHGSIDLPEKNSLPEGVLKICKVHGELRQDNAYKVNGKNHYQCKICKRERSLQFEERNPKRDREQTRNFIFTGGNKKIRVHKDTYVQMHNIQNGLCKICNQPETMISSNKTSTKRLAIDHCHDSGKIRGLLCHHCNVSLGGFKDSIELLEAAIKYLKLHA